MAQKIAISSGAIILREIDGQLRVALAQRRRDTRRWVLPKGHVEPGETLEQAALREIHEEAGLSVQLLTYLGSFVREAYPANAGPVQKTIHYYLAYALSTAQPELPTEEGFAEAGWFSPAEMFELLPYEQERAFLREHLGALLE